MKTQRRITRFFAAFPFALTATFAEAPKTLGIASLAFEPNRGQWAEPASFGVRTPGFSALFADGAAVTYSLQGTRVHARWLGSAHQPVTPLEPLPGTANYYVGADASRWISGIPTYGRLQARAIYPGIDVVFYGNAKLLEYDLMVAPGADPNHLRLSFEGGALRLDKKGNLVVSTKAGSFMQHKPVAFQDIAGRRTAVEARYLIARNSSTVRIALGPYDRRRELVIDPTIAWATTLGSGTKGRSMANAMTLDSAGNLWVAGTTSATDFPTVGAVSTSLSGSDAFVTKLSPDGTTILFSTYFGGNGDEQGIALAVDSSGNAVLVGSTTSTDLPAKNPLQPLPSDVTAVFAARFSANGRLLYSSYLPLGKPAGVALDVAGNIYIGGISRGGDVRTTPGTYQTTFGVFSGYVAKLSADGATLIFATYFDASLYSGVQAIAVGPDSSVYIAGTTTTSSFSAPSGFRPTISSNLVNAYVARLAPSGGSLIYATFLGWGGATAITVDSTGAAYVTGVTHGSLTLKSAFQNSFGGGPESIFNSSPYDAFLTKIVPDGSSVVYSTYLGGSSWDYGNAIQVDSNGAATVAGATQSSDFPLLAAFQANLTQPQRNSDSPRAQDAFVTRFDSSGNPTFSTLLGGNDTDSINALALDSSGGVYVAGFTFSTDFPAPSSRFQASPFIAKISGPVISIPVTFNTSPAGLQVIVDGSTVTTPHAFQWAPNVTHTLDVVSNQDQDVFNSWAHGGAKAQTLVTPATANTYTATFNSCPFTITSPGTLLIVPQTGLSSAFTFTTPAGCIWTAMSSAPWITLTGVTSGTGPGVIAFSVSPNAVGSRFAGITIGTTGLSISQTYSTPTVSNATIGGTGMSQTLQVTSSDQDGVGELLITNILVNTSLDGRQACYLAFDHQAQVLYLVNDSATALTGMPFDSTGHGSGTLSNGQCSVDGTKTFATKSTTQAQLTVALNYAQSFPGTKLVYLAARSKSGPNSDWITSGLWNIPGSAPARYPNVVSATAPQLLSGLGTLSATYQDAADNANLVTSQILINTALDGRNACYMGYDHAHNLLYLVNDAGTALLPAITPGVGTATQQNSQCTIYSQGSSSVPNGKNYALNVQIQLGAGLTNSGIVYAGTQTSTGGNSGWQIMSLVRGSIIVTGN